MQEVRSMLRARKSGVLTPCIFYVEHEAATIYMERIEGQTVRDVLLSGTLTQAGNPSRQVQHRQKHSAFSEQHCKRILQRQMSFCRRLGMYWQHYTMVALFMVI